MMLDKAVCDRVRSSSLHVIDFCNDCFSECILEAENSVHRTGMESLLSPDPGSSCSVMAVLSIVIIYSH